jgi:hypothetical protein
MIIVSFQAMQSSLGCGSHRNLWLPYKSLGGVSGNCISDLEQSVIFEECE